MTNFQQIIQYGELILKILLHFFVALLNPFESNNTIGSINLFKLSLKFPATTVTALNLKFLCFTLHSISWNGIGIRFNIQNRKLILELDGCQVHIDTLGEDPNITAPSSHRQLVSSHQVPKKKSNGLLGYLTKLINFLQPSIELKISNSNEISLVNNSSTGAAVNIALHDVSVEVSAKGHTLNVSSHITAKKISVAMGDTQDANLFALELCALDVSVKNLYMLPLQSASATEALGVTASLGLVRSQLHSNSCPALLQSVSVLMNNFKSHEDIKRTTARNWTQFCERYDYVDTSVQNTSEESPPVSSASISESMTTSIDSYERLKVSLQFHVSVNISVISFVCDTRVSTESESRLVEVIRLQCIQSTVEVSESGTTVDFSVQSLLTCQTPSTLPMLPIPPVALLSSSSLSDSWLSIKLLQSASIRNLVCTVQRTAIAVDVSVLSQLLYFAKDLSCLLGSYQSSEKRFARVMQTMSSPSQPVANSSTASSTSVKQEVSVTAGDVSVSLVDYFKLFRDASVVTIPVDSGLPLLALELIGVSISHTHIASDSDHAQTSLVSERIDDDEYFESKVDPEYNLLHGSTWTIQVSAVEVVLEHSSLVSKSIAISSVSVTLSSYTYTCQVSEGPEIQIPDFAELSTDYVLNWMRTFQSTKAFISLQNIAVGSVIIKLCQSDIIRLAFINSVINACSSTTAARNHIYKMLPLKVYPTYKSQFRRDYQKITALSVHIGHINASYLLEVTDRSSRTLPLLNINGLLVERVALNGMMSVMEVATGCDIEVECSDTRHDAIMYPAVFRLKAQFKKATDVRMISLLESFPIMGQHQRSVGSNKNLATHSLHVILQQVVFIHSVCQLDDAIACIGHVSSRLLIESEKLELCMESSTLTGVCNLIGAINKMGHDIGLYCRKELMNSFVTEDLSYIGKLPHVQYMYTNQLSPMLQQPSSLLVFRGRHIEIILGNENATVLHLPISDIAFTMTGFGGHISQMSGTVAGLEIVEVSQKLSLHPQFLSTFEVNGPIKNRLDFHLSTRRGAAPLLEVVIENARVIYLQRALATLISYFKDHLIPTAVRSVREGYASSRAQLLHQCNYNTAIASDHSDLDSAVSTIGQEYVKLFPKSAFRVGGLIKNVEAHFPANSCGGDSLALISPSLSLYMGRLDNETEIAYCKGPHLVKQVWMSDLDHVLDLMQPTFGIVSVLSGHRPSQTQRSVISSVSVPYSWQIRKHVDELIAPPHLSTHVGVKFRAQLENATLATWCSRSAFGTNMKVDILVSVVPIMPFTREVLGDDETDYVFGKEPIVIPPGPRNIVTIGLDIDKIDWVITQGQYHTLVNMLTQSFGEFQCNVKDMFVPPIPKKVKLSDDLYGRESPDEVLPLVTSVPVNFGAGRLFAVENEPEYYDLSSRLSRLHSEFKATGDSVPTWSCHHAHRRQLFTRTYPFSTSIEKEIKETKAKETKDSKSRSSLSGRSDPASKNRASVLRTQIGIRASNALNLGQIDPRAAIFETNKPLFCVYFDFIKLHFFRRHFGGGNGLDVYGYRFVVTEPILPDSLPSNSIEAYLDISLIPAEKIIAAPKDLPQVNPDMKQSFSTDIFAKMKSLRRMNSTKDGDDDPTVPARERSYNVAYHQQGISNLRRCVVNVTDSVIVVHMSAIFDMISFFMEPIRVNYLRSLSVLARSGLGILDFKANMDLEVHVKDSSFCLPRPTEEEGMSAICLAGDASYTQAWRGFLTAGPGRRPSSISVDVKSIFIAPIHDLRVTGVDSLIDPCEAHFAMDLCVVSDDATVESKLQALRPFMTLPSQEGKLNPTDRAVAYTSRSMKLFPTGKEHLLDLKFKKDKLNRSIKSSSPEKDSISSRSVEDSVTSDVDSVELRFSLKDIAFIVDASVKLSKAIKSRGIRPAVTERYELQFYSFYDVEHLPPLTFYHPSAKFKEFWTVGDAQVEVHSTDLNFIVRNNTYSMKIAKLALSNFQFSRFLHNRENLHVVSSGTVSAWTFNDNVNVWEPVLESVTVNLIAATDATERFDKSSRRCVHFDIFSTPVDVTIAQNALLGLIRKLTLADVVTTTSVYIPPYKIINELGVPVHCKVSAGGADDEDGAQIDIPVGGHVPVDRLQLTRAHRKTDESMKKSTRKNDKSDDGMEHRIDISFTIDNESYMSKESIPFDREGISAFEMKVVTNKQKRVRRKSKIGEMISKASNSLHSSRKETSASSSLSMDLLTGRNADTGVPLPYTLTNMRIKSDGGRELSLRSLLSLKNLTKEPLYLSIRRDEFDADFTLQSGHEWHVPVRLAHPNASLLIRRNESADWTEALRSLSALIVQGRWGRPTRLRADVCGCEASDGVSLQDWVILMKPEVRDVRLGIPTKSYLPVKFPSKELNRLVGGAGVYEGEGSMRMSDVGSPTTLSLEDIYQMSLYSSGSHSNQVESMCVQLLAPLQLFSAVCQPLLFRLSDHSGVIVSEGTLLSGEVIDVHALGQLFQERLYLSIRMLNYCWSKWIVIFTRSAPYAASERIESLTLPSMELTYQTSEILLPRLELNLSIREQVVRISCPIMINNRTGMQLDFCDGSSTENFVPLTSKPPAESFVPMGSDDSKEAKSVIFDASTLNAHQRRRNVLLNEFDTDEDDENDDDDSSETSSKSSSRADTDASARSSLLASLHLDVSMDASSFDAMSPKQKRQPPKLSAAYMRLFVHLPGDHFAVTEVMAGTDWLLEDVFNSIAPKLSTSKAHRNLASYIFLSWDSTSLTTNKIINSPAREETSYFGRSKVPGDKEGDPDIAQKVEKKTSIFDTGRLNKKESLFGSTIGSSIDNSTAEVPAHLQFDMLADCSSTPLSMDLKLANLQFSRLRLCHVSEWNLYRQVCAIKCDVKQKEGMTKYLSTPKVHFISPFMRFDGNIPFNPKNSSFISFQQTLSLRVPNQTDWSQAIDLLSSNFGSGSDYVSVSNSQPTDLGGRVAKQSSLDNQYEFGVYAEKGKGFYQNVTSISVVPKYILISKFPITLQLRQMEVDDQYSFINLNPNQVQSFHFPIKSKPRTLQVRRYSETMSVNDKWFGELDISSFGIAYIKLRNPLTIIKAQIAGVGASLATTFSLQDNLWPPYRVDNRTSFNIRFRQSSIAAQAQKSNAPSFVVPNVLMLDNGGPRDSESGVSRSSAAPNSSRGKNLGSDDTIPWDLLSANQQVSYAWDYPKSGRQTLRVEFEQLNNVGDNFSNVTWVGREFPLDTFTNQRNSSANTFTLTKPIASMDQTSAEGYLMVRSEGHTSSDWTQYYGVLQHDVIFLFKDESQTNLMHIINLCRRVYAIQSAHDLLQLGCIEKYQDKKKDFSIPFLSTAQQQKAAKRLDVNRHRILLLRLAEYMGAFDNSKNNEEDTGNGDVSSDSQGHGLQILLPGPQAMNIHDRVYSPRSSVRVSVRGRPVGSGGGYTTLVQSGLTTRLNHRSSLLSQLQSTRFVDQLMDEATTINFNIMDLLEALVAIGEARNDVEAIQLAAVLFEHGMIESFATDIGASSVPLDSNTSPSTSYDKSKRIDGSNSEKSGNRLQSARSVSSDRSATSVASGRSEPVFAELLRACGLDDLMVTSAAKGANDDSTLHALASSLMAIPNMIPNLRLGSGKMKGSSSAEMRRTGRHATVHGEVQTNLRFKMCSLNPEIFETVEQVQQGIGTKFESENNGFSVTLNNSVHHFLCASPQEYMLWIGNCRRNLERLWVKFELGEEIGENLDMHDYKVQVQAKVRADGPTKVLEFIEIGSKKKQKRILLSQSQMTSPMLQALSSTRSPLQKDASGRLASPTGNNVNEDDDDDNYDRMSEEKVTGKGRASNESVESDDDEEPDVTFEYVSDDDDGDGSKPTFPAQAYFFHPDTTFADPHTITSAKVEFVSFSVVDAQPAELIYLSFRDIAVSVERRMPILKLSVTVQSIIGCNQLLNPSYPVLLHPRMSSLIIPPDDVDGGGNLRQGRQLMLPGLIQTGDRYPCLHLYFQQKLRPHETRAAEASKAGGVTENNNADSNPLNLQYFEMVTAWLAPMELNLDDEILIRSVRYLQAVRLSLKRPDLGSQTSMLEDMLAVQHMGTKSWGICDAGVISENYFLFQESARLQYMEYQPLGKEKNFLYFSLLQLHPIDLVMRFRSLTGFSGTTTETAIVSIVSQLDSSRLCLNSFTVEDAFASTSLLADSIAKHYKASLWRQFRKLIGTGDLIEGTSNLTSNLGTGVRDIFYDPIDSLVEENSGTLIDGLSKGGASLASQAIGGAGSAAAKFTGGLGQGVSLLTLDAEFYRARANRRMNKAKTISEGLYVGTKELGKNIAEGVTGIVFAPYRGMQESGASGFATGLAKGILGAALKPAIGVFDFAARTGEGIRNATIGADEIIAAKLDASLARVRIPRHFSSSGTVVPFNNTSAAAQYMADKLTGFQSQNRPLIVFHQHLMRRLGEVGASSPFKLPAGYHPRQKNIRNTRRSDRSDMGDSIASMASLADTTDAGADEVVNQRSRLSAADFVDAEVDPDVLAELTGLDKVESAESANQRLSVDSVSSQRLRQSTTTRKGASSLRKELGLDELKQSPNESWGMCVGRSYVVLVSAGCIMLAQIQSRKPSAGFIDPTSSNTAGKPTVKSGEFKLIWSCPTAAVGELFSDSAGDLVLSMELPVTLAGNWNSLFPVIHDKLAQDFLIFQLFLEQTLGLALARLQPLQPMHGLLEGGLYKGYNNTMKSMMLNPTKHIFQLYGYVLYEYSTHKKTTLSQTMEYVNGPGDAKPSEVGTSQHKKDGDENVTEMVRQIFSPTGDNKNKLEERFVIPETEFLSCIYPLVDVKVDGPYSEESGKFSVTVKPKVEGGKLKILKREAESSLFQENVKSQVTILFPTREIAMNWRFALDERIARQPVDVISSPVQSELLRKYSGMQSTVTQTLRQVNAAIKSTIGSGGELEGDIEPNTIAGMLVIPTSGEKVEVSEALKIEIANVLRPTYDDK